MSNSSKDNGERLVLVVEDSATQAQMLRFYLEENGFSCLVAGDGKEALELLRTEQPALIVADVVMPEMDGFELAEQIKANPQLKQIPIILLTALTNSSDVIRGLECGADNFVTKPYAPDYLLTRINYLLANRALQEHDKLQFGIELEFGGKRHLITAERRQILDLLLSTYEQCMQINRNLHTREKELEASTSRLALLHNIAVTISQSLDLDMILDAALEELVKSVSIEVAAIFLLEEETLALKAHHHLPPVILQALTTRNLQETQVDALCRNGKITWAPLSPSLLEPTGLGQATDQASDSNEQTFLFVPLKAKGAINGLLLAGPFDRLGSAEVDQELMEGIANQLAVAVENVRLYQSAQKALEQAEIASHTKDEFLALVSHELRAPLNAILGWSNALLNKAVDEETRRRALETIERSARAQSQLIEDLLDMARVVSGKMWLEVRPVDLSDVINAALEVVRLAAEAKSIELKTKLEAQTDIITGDPDRLQQVVWNLLSNAIKFTPNGGQVEVKLERVDPHVQITVSDNGRGIKPDFQPYIFERFRQADLSGARRHGGLGLGLALVRQLVELHGGTIRVTSRGEDQGATFNVLLPLRAVRTQSVGDTQEMLALRGIKTDKKLLLAGLTILLVDDETDARELVTAVLKQYGADVLAVGSAAEALTLLAKVKSQERPDVIVSDIAMPEEDGYSLMRNIRALPAARGGNIPSVALTAFGRSSDRVRALAAGFQMHVPKPVEPAELALVVASLAGRTLQ